MTAYLASNLWAIWTAIAIICLIIELGSGDFFLTCFALGAFCSMIVSFTEAPLWTQILVFAICSVLSNSDALIGREGRVIEAIRPGDYGYVKIDGDEWKAQSPDDTTIEVGTTVKVIGRESIIISVERVQTSTYNNNQPT